MYIPQILIKISDILLTKQASAILVGGAVRDYYLSLVIKDYDIEVYGLKKIEELEDILSQYGSVNLVGKSFGVLKFTHDGESYDFSFPRVEQKSGKGHKGFEVQCDGNLTFKEACFRRDFTINAMGYDIANKRFLDPFNGKLDIANKRLCMVNSMTFIEDPLRVYRAVQFSARFEFGLETKTFHLCQKMIEQGLLEELPKERVYTEIKKLLLKATKPSIGFVLMKDLGILKYFPELEALVSIPQSKQWHPEGDVWIHTLMAVDKMSECIEKEEKYDLKMMFAILCHDLGKATHTQIKADKISAIGHEKAGLEPTKKLLERLTDEHDFINSILPLIEHHLAPTIYHSNNAKNSTIRKLATKVNIEELVTVARADFLGRTTKEAKKGTYEAGDWLLEKAKELNVYTQALKPLLQGRDLIALGMKPSREFKDLLEDVYLCQLEGIINTKDEAIAYIRRDRDGLNGLLT